MQLKSHIIFIFLVTILFCEGQTGSIEGTIFNQKKNSYQYFAGVYSNIHAKITSTDSSGYFIIENLPVGKHTLRIHIEWLGNKYITVEILKDSTINVSLNITGDCMYDKKRKSKVCPFCNKKDMVNFIQYGCIVSSCDPKFRCSRDNIDF